MVLPTGGDYTSIAAGVGLGAADSLAVETAYSLALEWSLNNYGIMRQFVSKRPERVAHPAQTVTMKKWNYFSEAAVNAAKTPLNEVQDVNARRLPAVTNVVIEAQEHGDVVEHTEFFEGRALVPFEAAKARVLADQSAKVIDELIQDQILSDKSGDILDLTSSDAVTGEGEGLITAENIREMGLRFLEENVPTYSGGFYLAVSQPRVLADIRREAGTGGWRNPKDYMDSHLLTMLPNEVGEFEGFRFVSNNRIRTTAADGADAQAFTLYAFGSGGLAEHVVTAPQVRVSPQTDALRRFHGLGWYFDMGWKVYEPKAVKVITSTAKGADGPTA
jgi:N4-gp56 family major capsid protein